jgi:hypothetical protein
LKKVLFGFLFTMVGLIGAILVVPNFIDWNEYREIITSKIYAATGLNLEIRGDITINILPSPLLRINDVHVANIEGAATADTLSVESFEVHVALAPLLGRQLHISSIKLLRPVLSLEILPDSRTNMTIKTPTVIQPNSSTSNPSNSNSSTSNPFGFLLGEGGIGPRSFRLDNFVVEKGLISYRDDTKGQIETIKDLNGRFAMASLYGPMESRGSGVVRGIPISFSVAAGAVVQGRTLPFKFNLESAPGDARLTFSGALTRLDKNPYVKGKLNITGKNFEALLSAFSGGASLPKGLARPFSALGTLAGDKMGGTVSNLMVELNGTQGAGKISVNFEDVTNLNVQMAISKFDLDAFLTPKIISKKRDNKEVSQDEKKLVYQDTGKILRSPMAKTSRSSVPLFSLKSLPKNISATINISVGAIVFNKSSIRQAKINAVYEDQEITISQASALLPGSTDVGLQGTIFNIQNTNIPRFNGTVDLTSNSSRKLVSWLGANVADIPNDRLRKLTINSKVLADFNGASLNDVAIQIDGSKMVGTSNIVFSSRPSFGVDFQIDRFNVDKYFPKQAAIEKFPPKTNLNKKGALSPTALGSDPVLNSTPNPLSSRAVFGNYNANIKLRLNALTLSGVPIRGLSLSAKMFDGALTLAEFKTADAAGLAVDMSGNILDLKKSTNGINPRFENFKFNINGKSLTRLFSFLTISPPIPPRQLGRAKLYGTVSGNAKALKVTTKASILGGEITFSGLVQLLHQRPRVDGQFSVLHPSLINLSKRLGSSYRPTKKNIGGLDIKGSLKGDIENIVFPDLLGKAAGISIAGMVGTDFSGTKPKLKVNIKTTPIVIDDFLPVKQTAFFKQPWQNLEHALMRNFGFMPLLIKASYTGLPRNMKIRPFLVKTAVKGNTPGSPWTEGPINLAYLKSFDGDIQLRSESLKFGKYQIDNVDMVGLLTDGVLDLQGLTGKAYDGTIKIDGRIIAARNTTLVGNQYQTRFKVAQVNMGKLLNSLGTRGFKGGALDFIGEFRGIGSSTVDLVKGLGGGGTISIRELDISSAAKKGSVLSGFANLFLSLQKFGGMLTGGKTRSKNADFNTSFRMVKGIASFEDMTLKTGLGSGAAKGFIDFPNWQINSSGEMQLSQNIMAQILLKSSASKPILPFRISGILSNPKVKLETAALTKGGIRLPGSFGNKLKELRKKKGVGELLNQIFPQTNSRGARSGSSSGTPATPSTSSEQAPQQKQKTPKVEDFLKGILKGLGR